MKKQKRALAALFALLPLSAIAADTTAETVTVARARGLAGLWKISVPAGFSIGFSGPARFGPMRDLYCRINEAGDIHCLSGGFATNGTAALDGDKAHIAWGSMMARMAIDAVYKDSGLTGTFTFKLSGIRHDAPEPSVSARIAPPSSSDTTSHYLAELMAQLAAGNVSSPHDAKAITTHGGALPADIARLGPLEAIAFLGLTPRIIDQPGGDIFSVHIVEFAHGERLCGLHQRSDGVLDAFLCV